MTGQTEAILDAVKGLPEEERIRLVEQLLETLSPEADELNDDELVAELDRRKAEFERGVAGPIPWSELRLEE